nr:hypothetical protein GCM10023233_33620 [Brevibacterium otitidis]
MSSMSPALPIPQNTASTTAATGAATATQRRGTLLAAAVGTAAGIGLLAGEVLRVETGKKVGDTSLSSALKHHTGNGVVVKHGEIGGDEMYSYYGHLSAVDVKPGDTVEAGTVVGKAGNTGNSTGPHLHFGVMVNSDEPNGAKWTSVTNTGFIDPHDWLKRKGVNAGSDAPVTP